MIEIIFTPENHWERMKLVRDHKTIVVINIGVICQIKSVTDAPFLRAESCQTKTKHNNQMIIVIVFMDKMCHRISICENMFF